MRKPDFLTPFAASLCLQVWSSDAIEAHLLQRLPARLHRVSRPLATALKERFPGTAAPDGKRIAEFLASLPEAARIRAFILRTGLTPNTLLAPPRFLPGPTFAGVGLPELADTGQLAEWLGISDDLLVRFADLRALSALSGSDFAPHYRHHLIPKKAGGLRLVEEPKPFLKTLQRRILRGILGRVPAHDASFGFRKGRNCIAAAARHAGEAVVVGFDLADFFPSISAARIYGLFRTLGYPQPVARHLTGFCTAVTPPSVAQHPGLTDGHGLAHRHLPQGAPTSPALANLGAYALDCRLSGLASALGAIYTRYADDLSFSGDRHIARPLLRAVPEIVAEEGFTLNPSKTRVAGAGRRQTVTGIVVNRQVNVPRPGYDRLKATLHHLRHPDDPRRRDPAFLTHLSGRISWVEQVNPPRGLRLRARFDALGLG